MKNKTKTIFIFLAIIAVGGFLWMSPSVPNSATGHELEGVHATVHKSPSCGCCANYVSYLRRNGLEVEVVSTDDTGIIKDQYEIPHDMQSCHTTVIGGQVIEGHIPLEAIGTLVKENPDIRGIAMPGMPSGSPGMPGMKGSPFIIHALMDDGNTSLFMEI